MKTYNDSHNATDANASPPGGDAQSRGVSSTGQPALEKLPRKKNEPRPGVHQAAPPTLVQDGAAQPNCRGRSSQSPAKPKSESGRVSSHKPAEGSGSKKRTLAEKLFGDSGGCLPWRISGSHGEDNYHHHKRHGGDHSHHHSHHVDHVDHDYGGHSSHGCGSGHHF